MKEFVSNIQQWIAQKTPFAMASVVQTWGSAPRPVGSAMLITADMEMAGSVSGGCVEGTIVRESQTLLHSSEGKIFNFGVADEDAWAVGLSCGGKIKVLVQPFMAFDPREAEQAAWALLEHCLTTNQPCVLLSRLADGLGFHTVVLPDGSFAGHAIEEGLQTEAIRAYTEHKSQVLDIGGTAYFAQVFPRKSLMLIIGAAHITVDLVTLASMYDFETVVIDPRQVFAHKTQFSTPPDQLFNQYPAEILPNFPLDAYTYSVILSHDPKIDDNALHVLLESKIAYIGALGSRKTHEKRVARLREAGYSEDAIDRIQAPIGVDINAQKPREIALSIMGEIIKVQNAFL